MTSFDSVWNITQGYRRTNQVTIIVVNNSDFSVMKSQLEVAGLLVTVGSYFLDAVDTTNNIIYKLVKQQ